MLGQSFNEGLDCNVDVTILRLQHSRIALTGIERRRNASLLEQPSCGAEQQHGLAMPILILEKFQRVAVRREFRDGGVAPRHDNSVPDDRGRGLHGHLDI